LKPSKQEKRAGICPDRVCLALAHLASPARRCAGIVWPHGVHRRTGPRRHRGTGYRGTGSSGANGDPGRSGTQLTVTRGRTWRHTITAKDRNRRAGSVYRQRSNKPAAAPVLSQARCPATTAKKPRARGLRLEASGHVHIFTPTGKTMRGATVRSTTWTRRCWCKTWQQSKHEPSAMNVYVSARQDTGRRKRRAIICGNDQIKEWRSAATVERISRPTTLVGYIVPPDQAPAAAPKAQARRSGRKRGGGGKGERGGDGGTQSLGRSAAGVTSGKLSACEACGNADVRPQQRRAGDQNTEKKESRSPPTTPVPGKDSHTSASAHPRVKKGGGKEGGGWRGQQPGERA